MYRIRNQLITPLQQLRWKFTFRYAGISLAVFFLAGFIFLLWLTSSVNNRLRLTPSELVNTLNSTYAPLARRYLETTPPDIKIFELYLEEQDSIIINVDVIRIGNYVIEFSGTNFLSLLFLNADRSLVGSLPHDIVHQTSIGEVLNVDEIPGLAQPLQAAQEGSFDPNQITANLPDGRTVGVVPVVSTTDGGDVLGYIAFIHTSRPAFGSTFFALVREFSKTMLTISLGICVAAIVIGFQTAKNFHDRIRKMMFSIQSWSRGNFSFSIEDASMDELGRMARSLNSMASKMEDLLEESGIVSVVDERKRLARELHDSFKQQAFAASALLGAASSQIDSNTEKAKSHLQEAEKLLNDIRIGLTDVISELRPSALEGRELINAIREYSQDCAMRNEIEVNVIVEGGRRLPLNVEQTLFRIVQGALSNVVRHSQATEAGVQLTYDTTSVTLKVSDNGKGFDITQEYNGLGLRSIRERVEKINGSLKIESELDQGTTITIKCIQ